MKFFGKSCAKLLILMLVLTSCKDYLQPSYDVQITPSPGFLPQINTPFIATSTITPIPTSTLSPILSVENANELVLHLLKDNTNCQLPCWWGISPVETTSQDAISILNAFSAISSTNSLRSDHGSIRLQIPNGAGILSTFIEYDSPNSTIDTLVIGITQIAKNENGDNEEIYNDSGFEQATKSIMLPEILKLYGTPEEILVSTYSLQPLGLPVLFEIQLFYPEYGFLITYKSLMEFSRTNYIKGCPSKGNIAIGLWESNKYLQLGSLPQTLRENISSFSLDSYLQIGEAANMSIQEFYYAFKDNGTLCLETPTNLWPFPGQ